MFIFVSVAVIIILFLFLVFPSLRRHNDRKILCRSLIAHRGLYDNARGIPENSLSAFSLAAAKGITIETDIHLTADGEIVVFHDDTLLRMCGEDKKIEELTLQELRRFRLLSTKEQIPTLKEVLTLIDGRVPLLIEIKCNPQNYSSVCSKADSILCKYNGKYFIQSFFPLAISWYRKNRNQVCRGIIASVHKDKGLLIRVFTPFLFNVVARPDFISYDVGHYKRFMFKLEKFLGAFPLGWTFHSEEQMTELKNEFKGYIFEGFEPKERR